jgi:hypothetical protein
VTTPDRKPSEKNMSSPLAPVLILGGSGVVGTAAVAALRRLQPALPITIGARDLARATAVAARTPLTRAVAVDLERSDLGLPAEARYSAVVTLLEDDNLRPMRWAQAHGVPYVPFSDYPFELAPKVALYAHAASRAPVLLLGHALGGAMMHHALHLAAQLSSVDSIQVTGVLYDDDHGGPATAHDVERGARLATPPMRKDGRWSWSTSDVERTVRTADGTTLTAHAYPLLDVSSLAAATDAQTVRFDLAMRPAATRRAGTPPSFEIIVEIAGLDADGASRALRREVVLEASLSAASGHGLAVALERLLGLAGGPPVPPGLYNPETILDPAHALERLALLSGTATAGA